MPTGVPTEALSPTRFADLSVSEIGETENSFWSVTPIVKLLLEVEPSLEVAVTMIV